MFTFTVDISGMQRRFSALIDATKGDALNEALLRTGGKVRARIKSDVFGTEGGGRWPALAASTQARKMNEHEVALLKNSNRGAGRGSPVRTIATAANQLAKAQARERALKVRIAELHAKGRTKALARATATMGTVRERIGDREHLIRQFRHRATAAGISNIAAYAQREVARERRHRESSRLLRDLAKSKRTGIDLSAAAARELVKRGASIGAALAGLKLSDEEKRAVLRKGARRSRASEQSTRMLGGLEDSIALHLVDGKRIEVFSKSRIGAIHNAGGTAGHDARIPKREFMFLVDSDIEFLAGLLREQMVQAWTDAAA